MIHTERLILRELVPADAEGMFQLDADPLVHTYLGQQPISSMQKAHDTITFIRQQYVDNGIGRWAVEEKDTGRFVGWAGLKYITEPINGHVNYYDIGYRLIRAHWGKGYASEAAHAWVAHAFNTMKLPALYGMANVNNAASVRILERVGLVRTGTFDLDNEAHYWFELKRDQWAPLT